MPGLEPLTIEEGLIQVAAGRRVEIQKLNIGPLVTIPVSSSTVTVTGSFHFLNNVGGGNQNVDNILGGVEGDILVLGGSGIRLRSVGNLSLPSNFLLQTGKSIVLVFIGNWFQLSRTT